MSTTIRCMLAVLGGYLISWLFSLVPAVWGGDNLADNLLISMMASFLVYAAWIIVSFLVRDLRCLILVFLALVGSLSLVCSHFIVI